MSREEGREGMSRESLNRFCLRTQQQQYRIVGCIRYYTFTRYDSAPPYVELLNKTTTGVALFLLLSKP